MILYEMNGYMYTVTLCIRRTAKSCASIEDFSTYDSLTDSYGWKEFDDAVFAVVPSRRKQQRIFVTLYLHVPQKQTAVKLQSTARKILQKRFFPNVCGVTIESIGKPKLFFEPPHKQRKNLDDTVPSPARVLDLITHV
jgi:hypothetical protein